MLIKKLLAILVISMAAAIAAYASCPPTVIVVSGCSVYECKNTGTTPGGACIYDNCTYVGRKAPCDRAAPLVPDSGY